MNKTIMKLILPATIPGTDLTTTALSPVTMRPAPGPRRPR